MLINAEFLKKHDFKISFLKSLLLHISLILVIYLLAQVKFLRQANLIAENILLVESSVRVDLVGMPTQTLQELEVLSRQVPLDQTTVDRPAPEREVETALPEVHVEDQTEFLVESKEEEQQVETEVSSDDFFALLRQRSEQDFPAPREETAQERELRRQRELSRQRLQELVLRGNQVSEGVALVGSTQQEASNEFILYLQGLPDLIRPHWSLPRFLQDQNLRTLIRVYVADTGRLLRAEIYESSGNEEFDQRAMRAVNQSAPFPAPEEAFRSRLARGDVILAFPL